MWYDESVIYQIYPLGYVGAPDINDGNLEHRILKIKQHIPHFKKLNINAIYFCPIFESSKHGYDTKDFSKLIVGWARMKILRSFVKNYIATESKLSLMEYLIMLAGISLLSRMFNQINTIPFTRIGFILTLMAIVDIMMVSIMKVGKAILS